MPIANYWFCDTFRCGGAHAGKSSVLPKPRETAPRHRTGAARQGREAAHAERRRPIRQAGYRSGSEGAAVKVPRDLVRDILVAALIVGAILLVGLIANL